MSPHFAVKLNHLKARSLDSSPFGLVHCLSIGRGKQLDFVFKMMLSDVTEKSN